MLRKRDRSCASAIICAALCRRLAQGTLAIGVAAGATLQASPAHAESAVSCLPARIVEIFAGTEACPSAQYVVLEHLGGAQRALSGPSLHVLDQCGRWVRTLTSEPLEGVEGSHYLVARPEAAALFGITPDHIMGEGAASWPAFLPVPSGRLNALCGGDSYDVVYGAYPNATAPALVLGKALRWNGASWTLVDPAPRNTAGDIGVLGMCPADAGLPPATDAGTEECVRPEAGAEAGFSGSGGSAGDASVEAGTAARGGTGATGAGPSPNADDGDSDCGCRVPGTGTANGYALLAALGALVALRRGRR